MKKHFENWDFRLNFTGSRLQNICIYEDFRTYKKLTFLNTNALSSRDSADLSAVTRKQRLISQRQSCILRLN